LTARRPLDRAGALARTFRKLVASTASRSCSELDPAGCSFRPAADIHPPCPLPEASFLRSTGATRSIAFRPRSFSLPRRFTPWWGHGHVAAHSRPGFTTQAALSLPTSRQVVRPLRGAHPESPRQYLMIPANHIRADRRSNQTPKHLVMPPSKRRSACQAAGCSPEHLLRRSYGLH